VRELRGVYVPVPTPFRGDQVATDRLRANLERWNQTGLPGYVFLGATGEAPMLSEAERDAVLAAGREAVPRDRAFVAGTGAESTLHTIRQTRRAADLGADIAIVTTPHHFAEAFQQAAAQVRHYLTVADASPIPVMIDNAPAHTGIGLLPDTVARIAEHGNVCGMADSSCNIAQDAHIIHLTPKSFHVLVGGASALLPALTIGASGGVLAMAAIAPREYVAVHGLARDGRWEEAKELAARLVRADRGVLGRYGIGGLKAGLDLLGYYGGPCRSPLSTPDGDAIEDIKESLASAGLV
jgi:4-hydroxy-2-oxoglutarate aldolase